MALGMLVIIRAKIHIFDQYTYKTCQSFIFARHLQTAIILSNSRDIYQSICQQEYIPWYAQPWWLDAVVGPDHWNVAISTDEKDRPNGALPYTFRKRYGISTILLPPLTAHLHIWIRPSASNRLAYQYAHQQAILQDLVAQLPSVRYFDQQYDGELQNLLPFQWQGYRSTVRYTYQLRDLTETTRIHREMSTSTRNHIRKARKQSILQESPTDRDLVRLVRSSMDRKKIPFPFSDDHLFQLLEVLRSQGVLRLYAAEQSTGATIASIAVVQDKRLASYWLSGATAEGLRSGSISFLLWEAIKQAARSVETFDFEGSMVPSVESLFRSFGGERIPYYRIFKGKPRLLEIFRR
jgi:hypothetical protein